jgi:hypothetical protein
MFQRITRFNSTKIKALSWEANRTNSMSPSPRAPLERSGRASQTLPEAALFSWGIRGTRLTEVGKSREAKFIAETATGVGKNTVLWVVKSTGEYAAIFPNSIASVQRDCEIWIESMAWYLCPLTILKFPAV